MLTFLTILFLALLILGHEFGHFLAAKLSGVKVEEFGIGFPPKLASKKFGETNYSLNLLPFGGFVRIHGENDVDPSAIQDKARSFYHQSFSKKAFIISAGVIINILIGWIAFSMVIAAGVPGGVVIERVFEDSPAELAGFSSGEVIEGFESLDEFLVYLETHQGQEIVLNGKSVTPRVDVPPGEGPLGVSIIYSGIEATPFPQNLWLGLKLAFKTLSLIFSVLGSFLIGALTGNFEALGQVTGPVGVFSIARQAGEMGSIYLIQFLGMISLNLAVLNIIPFPALDGGRLLFLSLQKVFGEKVLNKKMEVLINVAGFLFLISLMILVTIRDIMNL